MAGSNIVMFSNAGMEFDNSEQGGRMGQRTSHNALSSQDKIIYTTSQLQAKGAHSCGMHISYGYEQQFTVPL